MNEEKFMIKLTVAHAKCLKCGFERILYFMSNFSYGERIVSTKDGKLCAYVNLLEEEIIPEVNKICQEIFSEMNIEISKNQLGRIVSNMYTITCDEIDNQEIDDTPSWKCGNCSEGKMEEDKEFGEQLMSIEVPFVKHARWKSMDENGKKKAIMDEMKKQGYI